EQLRRVDRPEVLARAHRPEARVALVTADREHAARSEAERRDVLEAGHGDRAPGLTARDVPEHDLIGVGRGEALTVAVARDEGTLGVGLELREDAERRHGERPDRAVEVGVAR